MFIKNNSFILSGAADVLFFAALIMHTRVRSEFICGKGAEWLCHRWRCVYMYLRACVCKNAEWESRGWPLRVVFFAAPFLSFYGEWLGDTCIKRIAKGRRFTQDWQQCLALRVWRLESSKCIKNTHTSPTYIYLKLAALSHKWNQRARLALECLLASWALESSTSCRFK